MRRQARWTVRLIAAALALAACAPASVPIPGADSVIAELPTYTVGDEWRFTGAGYESRVWIMDVTGDRIVQGRERPARYETCPGCRYIRDRQQVLLEVVDPAGQRRDEGEAGLRALAFPLRVGATWTSTTPLYRDVFTVESYERVTVPAGTFPAFRIRQDRENTASGWRGTAVSWWAPEVRWFVRIGRFRDQPGGDLALASYSLK